jgi:hypothetical protein
MMIMEMEKDWALFCFNCVLRDAEVGGDLLFAAQITDEMNISHSSASMLGPRSVMASAKRSC